MESWTEERLEYERHAREICDLAILTTKDSWFWKTIAWSLCILSLGRMSRRRFLEDFATTMGPIQAYPRHWRDLSPLLVVHESRHCQQFLIAGWFVPIFGWFFGRRVRLWLGLLPMALIYGMFPIPVFFAWGRFRLELDAELQAWRAALDNKWLSPEQVIERARDRGALVSSWDYLKSWPKTWAVSSFQRRAMQLVESRNLQKDSGQT